jgi:hypothetical protein
MTTRRRPNPDEHAPYYSVYIDRVPDGDVVTILREQMRATQDFLAGFEPARQEHRYAPGKWSVKEVVGHIIDTEWVFTQRALWFARGIDVVLPDMDQHDFVAGTDFDARPWESLLDELRHLRGANTRLFESFDEAVQERTGVAAENTFTVRSIPYIVAGHELHHVGVLKERYLS